MYTPFWKVLDYDVSKAAPNGGGRMSEDFSALVRAIEDLTDEIRKYRKVKERGVDLAEEIEGRR